MFAATIETRYKTLIIGLVSVLILFLAAFFSPVVGHAQSKSDLCTGANLTFDTSKGGDCDKDASGNATCAGGNCAQTTANNLIADIVNVFSIIVGIAAVIMIIYGGFRYITSGGEAGNISAAKNTILYAIVGLIIVALAQFIVKFILNKVAS